jgi:hypothetical protein
MTRLPSLKKLKSELGALNQLSSATGTYVLSAVSVGGVTLSVTV